MASQLLKIIESAFIIIGILSLWPYILGVRSVYYFVFLGIVLVSLLILLWVRVNRVRKGFETLNEQTRSSDASSHPYHFQKDK